jgi:Porin PorA
LTGIPHQTQLSGTLLQYLCSLVAVREGYDIKKFLAPALIFFGIALVTAAIAVPLWLVPKLKVVPLDLDITSVATSVPAGLTDDNNTPARVFNRCSISEPRAEVFDAHLTQQRRSIIINPSDSDQATLQSGQTVMIDLIRDGNETYEPTAEPVDAKRTCEDAVLTSNVDVVSVDRETSKPNGSIARIHTVEAPEGTVTIEATDNFVDAPREGYQYKFGFDVEKSDQLYYDANSRQDVPATFVEEAEINGLTAYHFVSDVPEVDQVTLPTPNGEPALGTSLEKPASWWGIKGVPANELVVMDRFAKATRHVWVEPQTGTILKGMEEQHQYFKSPGWEDPDLAAPIREFRMDAFAATMEWQQTTIERQSDKASGYVDQLRIGGVIVPAIIGTVGGLLFIAGVVLLLRRPKDTGDNTDTVQFNKV